MSSTLHVVFGAGQIGAGLARTLRTRGHRVRVVRRSDRPVGDDIEVVQADATDPQAAVRAAAGAAVIHHCMNPSNYSKEAWQDEFPKMGEAVIAAALATGARLVCLDNVYAYGPMEGPRRETSELAAKGPKGRVRSAWDARLREAGETQGLRWTAGRAGDFWGPGTSEQSLMSMATIDGLGRGRPALLLGRPWHPHSFSYAPDVVDALAALGSAEADVEGRAWHVPVHTVAPRDLVRRLAQAQGRRGWAVRVPGWLLRALALVVPLFDQLKETMYQWEDTFLIDDSDFRARFPGIGRPLDAAILHAVATLNRSADLEPASQAA